MYHPTGGSPDHTVHNVHTHRMRPIPSSNALAAATSPGSSAADVAAATAGDGHASDDHGNGGLAMETSIGSPAQPYVSEFGSLRPKMAGSSMQLNRILLTHAPYMTKLESLASSATRCGGCGSRLFGRHRGGGGGGGCRVGAGWAELQGGLVRSWPCPSGARLSELLPQQMLH